MNKAPKYLIFLLATLIISGCSTFKTNFEYPESESQWGNEYSGTVCSAQLSVMTLALPIYWPIFPFVLVDTGLSLIADTVLLPFELVADNPDYGHPNCGRM